ncbi:MULTISPECIES: hypothetical protein [unclassified Methylobacter]|uniref:hypothetical protein n=1 Tax=unclassified Methylobacter TaxID=2635283 RepID=UPI00189476D4|nr:MULTISPECIES: hypothetical protein [unclassified Methylobacter]MBF6649127.1 hypothetical protein [Methylobacter sp. BlB1]WAK04287.1 hypothetical protein LZ558_21700 [Methylobacter sp. YRD-M1]
MPTCAASRSPGSRKPVASLEVCVLIDADADPELYQYLDSVHKRRRAEHIRMLAASGLGIGLRIAPPAPRQQPLPEPQPEPKAMMREAQTAVAIADDQAAIMAEENAIFGDLGHLTWNNQ